MNCQRFEETVSDIACEQILDAGVRSDALAHCHECESCAVRLEDELELTHRLRNFAGSFHSMGAPARVETQVLAAFEPRTLKVPLRATVSRQRYWISAIAALVLIVFALSIIRLRQLGPPTEKKNAGLIAEAGGPATPISSSPRRSSTSRSRR